MLGIETLLHVNGYYYLITTAVQHKDLLFNLQTYSVTGNLLQCLMGYFLTDNR